MRDSSGVSGGGGGILKGFFGSFQSIDGYFFRLLLSLFNVLLGLIGILWDSWGFLEILEDS